MTLVNYELKGFYQFGDKDMLSDFSGFSPLIPNNKSMKGIIILVLEVRKPHKESEKERKSQGRVCKW